MATLSIVIPAYNEGRTIHLILNKVKEVQLMHQMQKEIIIVNDCSKDNTEEAILQYKSSNPDLNISYYKHEVNKGKGAALHTGIKEAKGDYIIIQDADLEYDPKEYPKLLKPLLEGNAEAVYGSRFLSSGERRAVYFWHRVGNQFLTLLSNMFTNIDLTDMETCYKMMKTPIAKNLKIVEQRFGLEPEITARLSKLDIRIYEVPISYYGRTYDEGKKITWKDGFSAIRCIIKYNIKKS
jgi:glycosyltransferase involved in cell wall biosynthesis